MVVSNPNTLSQIPLSILASIPISSHLQFYLWCFPISETHSELSSIFCPIYFFPVAGRFEIEFDRLYPVRIPACLSSFTSSSSQITMIWNLLTSTRFWCKVSAQLPRYDLDFTSSPEFLSIFDFGPIDFLPVVGRYEIEFNHLDPVRINAAYPSSFTIVSLVVANSWTLNSWMNILMMLSLVLLPSAPEWADSGQNRGLRSGTMCHLQRQLKNANWLWSVKFSPIHPSIYKPFKVLYGVFGE